MNDEIDTTQSRRDRLREVASQRRRTWAYGSIAIYHNRWRADKRKRAKLLMPNMSSRCQSYRSRRAIMLFSRVGNRRCSNFLKPKPIQRTRKDAWCWDWATESTIETGITLHHTYGVPYLSGSALKGLVAHFVRNHVQGDQWGTFEVDDKRPGRRKFTAHRPIKCSLVIPATRDM